MNRIVLQTNTPYKMPIRIGYLSREGICFAKKKKKKVNEMAIMKWTSSPTAASIVSFEKVFGSTAPLATYFKTCDGVVPAFKYACMQAAVISNVPATKPAVNALAKNDRFICFGC